MPTTEGLAYADGKLRASPTGHGRRYHLFVDEGAEMSLFRRIRLACSGRFYTVQASRCTEWYVTQIPNNGIDPCGICSRLAATLGDAAKRPTG